MKPVILYIDDELENLESFRLAFRNHYDIELASSTLIAEKILKEKEVALVIADHKMPSETGLAFIKRIKSQYPLTTYILLTAYSELELVINAINVGIDGYIQKPWLHNEMSFAIENAVEKYELKKQNIALVVTLKKRNEQLKQFNSQITSNSTKLLKSQSELSKREKLLAAIYKNLPIAVVIVDENTRIITVNHTGRNLAGTTENEIIGQLFGKAFHCSYMKDSMECTDKARETCIIRSAVKHSIEHKTDNFKTEGQLPFNLNGSTINKIISLSATYLEQEQPMVLLSFDEITQQRKNETQLLIQNKKLESINSKLESAIIKSKESDMLKSGIIANISHEIRTPMNGIIGFSEMLMKPSIPDEKKEIYLNIIRESSFRLLRIVNDILDISKIETDNLDIINESFCVNSLIMEMQLLFIHKATKKNIELIPHKDLQDNESVIISDRLRLVQILNNLLENAFKFTEKGKIEYGYLLKNDFLEFYIADNGIGIAEEQQNKVFEGFYQVQMNNNRKFAGIGVGLSISQKLVELLGGKIWLKSFEGKGSTFYFTIPYNKSQ
ncbi:MAG: ATP-binding protein [Bacteroidales bacterium]|nr:ATP-binding protein [Bacteroidales bacterium]